MPHTEWEMWANEHTFASSIVLLIGCILCYLETFTFSVTLIHSIICGFFILIMEYLVQHTSLSEEEENNLRLGLGDKNLVQESQETSASRSFNYYLRFATYFCISLPCCLTLPTLMGGLCILAGSILYFMAGKQQSNLQSKVQTDRKPVLTNNAL